MALQEAICAGRLEAEISLVVSDFSEALILERAKKFGLPTAVLPDSPFRTKLSPEGEETLVRLLKEHRIDWVILAGYMRVVKEPLLSAYAGKIINIHPSLLPAFKGLRAWEQALAAGVKETGCTVHYVNDRIDEGQIIEQEKVPVLPDDTAETLHARIQIAEHQLYPRALARLFRENPMALDASA